MARCIGQAWADHPGHRRSAGRTRWIINSVNDGRMASLGGQSVLCTRYGAVGLFPQPDDLCTLQLGSVPHRSAVAAMVNVTEPMMNGLGGNSFILVHWQGKLHGLCQRAMSASHDPRQPALAPSRALARRSVGRGAHRPAIEPRKSKAARKGSAPRERLAPDTYRQLRISNPLSFSCEGGTSPPYSQFSHNHLISLKKTGEYSPPTPPFAPKPIAPATTAVVTIEEIPRAMFCMSRK
jgi:hypothetical protein